jgi:phage tail P2-like protein
MTDLLPPLLAADERCRILEQLSARLQALDLSPLLVNLVDRAEDDVLLYLADQFNVVESGWWGAVDDAQERRELIKLSIALHRRKGTPWALRRLLESAGVRADIREWWQTGGDPFTFEIDILANRFSDDPDVPYLGSAMTARMQQLINTVKPVRAHYAMRVGIDYGRELGIGGALNRPQVITSPVAAQPLDRQLQADQGLALGAGLQRPSVITVTTAGQDANRQSASASAWQYAAALERPALVITGSAGQSIQFEQQAGTTNPMAAAMSRPTVLCAAVLSQ